MTRLNAGLLGQLIGKVGNVVVVNRGKTTYVRSMPNYANTVWTDRQKQVRKRFGLVGRFCSKYKKNLIIPIWNLKPGNSSGYNQFLTANIKAFDIDGNIMDMSLLHFSQGNLPPACSVSIEKQQAQVTISWKNELYTPDIRLKDKLWYMAVVDGQIVGPYSSGLTRGMLGGVFTLKDPATSAIYAYFAASDKKSFSPDKYLAL